METAKYAKNTKNKLIRLLIFMFVVNVPFCSLPDTIAERTCTQFYTPFKESQREEYRTLRRRCISTYGAPRLSIVRGHKHSGIDLKGKFNEKVYPVGVGQVVDIHLSFPHLTLVVKHYLPNGKHIYSSYKHIEDIQVEIGDWVDKDTYLARLFNPQEKRASGFQVVHLHFEIRKSIEDGGTASWTSMTMEELNRYCLDPLEFFKKHLK